MAKSIGLFKKKADEEEDARPEKKRSAAQPAKGEPKDKGALDDAFEDIEAEEKTSESPSKLFRITDRPEDELIQFLDEKPKVAVVEPEPPEVETVRTKIVEPQPRKERTLRVPVRIGGSSSQAVSEPAQPTQKPRAEPAPVERQPQPVAAKAPEPREERPAPQQAPPKAEREFPEDTIYEMIKSQTFARVPQTSQRFPKRPERPRTSQAQRQVLRPPAPMPELTMRPPEKTAFQPAELVKTRQEAKAKRRFTAGAPILTQVNHDYLTLTLMMRWVEFLFERVTRDKLSIVLDYYMEVGWISEEVRSEVMAYARGEMQDVTKYMPHEEEISDESPEFKGTSVAVYKKVDDWRLSADDHLKSLLFITKMAGAEVDKDKLNSLEQTIKRFKENLEGFYGV